VEITLTKIHGCANDYLFADCRAQPLQRAGEVARRVSDRRRGIGSDGLILIYPSSRADFRMEMYNADGSRGAMCGNGIRGFGKYVADRGLAHGNRLRIETDAGIKTLDLLRNGDGKVASVTVDMGPPILEGRRIPCNADGEVIERALEVAGRTWNVTCVSMGNPHCVSFDADPTGLDLSAVGPAFTSHPFFPAGVNAEFARVDSRSRLTMRVWERGSGETWACGTGACAVLVAAVLTGRADRKAIVSLPGGDLQIEYRPGETVLMTGPAVEVFTTTVRLDLDRP
jgi:diaminopimelate epimerase